LSIGTGIPQIFFLTIIEDNILEDLLRWQHASRPSGHGTSAKVHLQGAAIVVAVGGVCAVLLRLRLSHLRRIELIELADARGFLDYAPVEYLLEFNILRSLDVYVVAGDDR
jgi:hypothetical protein